MENQLRMAAYEVLNTFITNAANDCLPIVAKLSDVIIERLENTIPMQHQIVSVEDRLTLEEIQTSLTSGVLVGSLSLARRLIINWNRTSSNAWKAKLSHRQTEL